MFTRAVLFRFSCRPGAPLSLDDARRLASDYVDHYNNVRLNSATGYMTPRNMLAGRQQEVHAEWKGRLEAARKQRQFVASKPLDQYSALFGRGCGGLNFDLRIFQKQLEK